jgi:hypothetical protein
MQLAYSRNDVVVSETPLDLTKSTKRDFLNYLKNTYEMYETIFRGFTDEDALHMIPDKLRRPLIFYLGHTVTFSFYSFFF